MFKPLGRKLSSKFLNSCNVFTFAYINHWYMVIPTIFWLSIDPKKKKKMFYLSYSWRYKNVKIVKCFASFELFGCAATIRLLYIEHFFFLQSIADEKIIGFTIYQWSIKAKIKSYSCFKTLNLIFSQGAQPNIYLK